MQTIEEYKAYTKQLEGEVGKWHHAYDALMVERNQLARELATWKTLADDLAKARIIDEQQRGKKMNEHEHIYDDCIGNPPFSAALEMLGGV